MEQFMNKKLGIIVIDGFGVGAMPDANISFFDENLYCQARLFYS